MNHPSCVQLINRVRKYRVHHERICQLTTHICERLGVDEYEVCLQFVSPRTMQKLNKTYRNKNNSTDVLSFPQYEWKKPLKSLKTKDPKPRRSIMNPMPLGDVIISLDDALGNARESQHRFDFEVCFLIVHGILHLVGHDHMKPSEKRRMFAEQKKLMASFGRKNPLWLNSVRTQPNESRQAQSTRRTKTKTTSRKGTR